MTEPDNAHDIARMLNQVLRDKFNNEALALCVSAVTVLELQTGVEKS